MKHRNLIFVVLVYRNANDLNEFLISVEKKCLDYKVIVVNAFYDEETKFTIKQLAESYDADFINIKNKGYSYGNNYGIKYALCKYKFDFLIVSNPDILIECIDVEKLDKDKCCVWGAVIKNKKAKDQNPFRVLKFPLGESISYWAYKSRHYKLVFFEIIINKIIRVLFLIWFNNSRKTERQIYSVHGSFIAFSYSAINQLKAPFNENMFLFAEEDYLANKLKKMKIPVIYTKTMKVFHKEDGSVILINFNKWEQTRDSYITFYEGQKTEGEI